MRYCVAPKTYYQRWSHEKAFVSLIWERWKNDEAMEMTIDSFLRSQIQLSSLSDKDQIQWKVVQALRSVHVEHNKELEYMKVK